MTNLAATKPSQLAIVAGGRCKTQQYLDFDAGAGPSSPPMDLRHNGGCNVLFADGHVEWMNPKTLASADYRKMFVYDWGALWPASGQ